MKSSFFGVPLARTLRCHSVVVMMLFALCMSVGAARAATFIVSNNNDSGSGSLRSAITSANSAAGDDSIGFTTTGVITLASALPNLSSNIAILGPGANNLTVSGNNANRVFYVASGTVSISDLTISGGKPTGSDTDNDYGGGIYNNGTLTVMSITVSGNSGFGGGIYNNGTMTVMSITVSGNSASFSGGIYNLRGTLTVTSSTVTGNSSSGLGGGIANSGGTLTVTSSTVSGNSIGSVGGGIYNSNGSATVTNSTVSGNSAPSGYGGGIYNGGSTVTVTSSTIAGNSAASNGGGIYNSSGSVILGNTLLSKGSTGTNYFVGSVGTLTSQGYNLSNDASGPTSGTGDRVNVSNLNLDTLKDNGGPTKTIALLAGSAAINAGDPNALAAPTSFDQRGDGYARVKGGRLDVGAFESDNEPPVADPQSIAVVENSSVAITLTGSDPNALPLTFEIVTAPTNGNLSGTGANIIYTPNAGYVGPDEFTFKVNNGTLDSAAALVSINVTPDGGTGGTINRTPIAVDDTKATDENTALSFPASDLIANDSAGEGDVGQTLTVVSVSAPSHGTVTLAADGTITFTPETDYVGEASFSYLVQDDDLLDPKSAMGTVYVTVNAVNQAPVIAPISDQTAFVGVPFSVTATASDPDGNALTWSLGGTVPTGLTIDPTTGAINWTPTLTDVGDYTITVQVTDDGTPNLSDTKTFVITVYLGGGGTTSGSMTSGSTTSGSTTSGGTTSGGTTGSTDPLTPGAGLKILKKAAQMYNSS